eukprot:g15282.t1
MALVHESTNDASKINSRAIASSASFSHSSYSSCTRPPPGFTFDSPPSRGACVGRRPLASLAHDHAARV